uniref:ubiquitinyl hydrolase 1 n=1 Tax=Hyaloperonospora arabidopsidis (strain Emoy2) TaxID=559515 RepID=M4B609_HYAAE
MQWVDKRLPVDEKLVNLDQVEGLLCNVVLSTVWSSLWMSRHWFAIRKIRGVCYNLDSKLATPMELVNTGECELFVVLKESTTMEQTHLSGGNDDL